jgi:hypothetical protein
MARPGFVLNCMRQITAAHPSHRHPFPLFREKLDPGAFHRARAHDVFPVTKGPLQFVRGCHVTRLIGARGDASKHPRPAAAVLQCPVWLTATPCLCSCPHATPGHDEASQVLFPALRSSTHAETGKHLPSGQAFRLPERLDARWNSMSLECNALLSSPTFSCLYAQPGASVPRPLYMQIHLLSRQPSHGRVDWALRA